jgi:hypothetical protein
VLFNSYEFILVFLPIVVAGTYLLAQTGRTNLVLYFLSTASLFFYAWWDWSLAWVLAGPHHFSRDFMNFRNDNSEGFAELLAGYPAYSLRLVKPSHRKELFQYWKVFLLGHDFLTRQLFNKTAPA